MAHLIGGSSTSTTYILLTVSWGSHIIRTVCCSVDPVISTVDRSVPAEGSDAESTVELESPSTDAQPKEDVDLNFY